MRRFRYLLIATLTAALLLVQTMSAVAGGKDSKSSFPSDPGTASTTTFPSDPGTPSSVPSDPGEPDN